MVRARRLVEHHRVWRREQEKFAELVHARVS
jgi:hypothetical protein